jgi:RNA polymerase sigma factor (sigma-70 family)
MSVTQQSTRAKTALDDLYRRHVGDVYRYTYAVLGNHADAEDVTQTTFVNALRALERGEHPRNPSSWLLAIAHNLVRQRWRQAAARPTEIELVGDVPAQVPDEEIELDSLVKALQKIPPAQREALVMRELEGRSYQEIAELLGVTTSALETLLFRARRSLAEELENLVTCQSAELAISQQLDGRLSRKDRRRLKEHLDECAACARLAEMQGKQRRAFKGLALLPVPIGLALFKGAPAASAAIGLPTIGVPSVGVGATGLGGASATGTATTTTAGAGAAVGAGTGVGAGTTAGAGGAAVGGSLVGGAAAKIAAVVVAATLVTGAGYEGLKAVNHAPPSKPAAGHSGQGGAARASAGGADAAATGSQGARATPPVVAGVAASRQSPESGLAGERTGWTDGHVDNGVRGQPEDAPGHTGTGNGTGTGGAQGNGGNGNGGAQGNGGNGGNGGTDKPANDAPGSGQSTTGGTAKTTVKDATAPATGPRPRDYETGKPASAPGQVISSGDSQGQGPGAGQPQGQGGGPTKPDGTKDPKGEAGATEPVPLVPGASAPSGEESGPQIGQGKGGKGQETG